MRGVIMMQNEFQYRLVKAIADKRLSAADLVRMTGIDKGSMSNYISGKYVPKQDKCYLLARALDVDPGWLMTGDEPKNGNRFPGVWELPQPKPISDGDILELIAAWSKAEEWQKSAVRKLLNMKGDEQ